MKEQAVGNYLSEETSCLTLQMNDYDRETMIALMQEIHRIKRYRIETLFLACSILDRFLQKLSETGIEAPNLVLLATVGLMIAAKLNEHAKPCFELTIRTLPPSLR